MMISPSRRNLYTHPFNTANRTSQGNHYIYSSSPIYANDDCLFHQAPKTPTKDRCKHSCPSSKYSSVIYIPFIMSIDGFLNELIDLYEQQTLVNIQSPYSLFDNDLFFSII